MYAYIGWSFQTADEIRVEIYDFDGNLISNEYNYIESIIQGDGYFLVASCFGENAGEVCYDENGNPYEAGCWFVDDMGNKLSERFEHIEVERFRTQESGFWQIEKVIVTDENGNEKEISYEPYKIYYEEKKSPLNERVFLLRFLKPPAKELLSPKGSGKS